MSTRWPKLTVTSPPIVAVLTMVRAQRDEAEAKITEITDAGDDAWAGMKAGFDKAWDSISSAFNGAMFRFK